MNTCEEWRDIAGYEGLYQVSNLGQIRSLDRTEDNGCGRMRKRKGVILRQFERGGYLCVRLSKNGKGASRGVHIYVAKAFLEPVDGKNIVDHIDGVKTNNNVNNLRYVTPSENNLFAYKLGLIDKEKLSKRSRRIIEMYGTATPPKPVVRDDGVVFESEAAAARAIGTTQSEVSAVVLGKRRSCKGRSFRFAKQAS